MSSRIGSDRRQHPRFAVEMVLWVRRANDCGGEWVQGVLCDYSQGGLRFLLERPFPSNEKIVVEFRQLHDSSFSLTAEVAWTERTLDGRYQAGCKLAAELTPRQMALLEQHAGVHLV